MAAAPDGAVAPPRIRAIDPASVHRICSGQVVLDLASAVKELVENALDAGATVVEVRLKEHGSELVEVSDNGSGVAPEHYASLTAKYHTSKLSSFADLATLSTFGFRGEALSSLCSLCDLSVVTRTAVEEAGTRLEYDHLGAVTSRSSAPRAPGTTVVLKELFKTLPVRHQARSGAQGEFLRNLKREYGKALAVLQAYALICRGVRLVVTHACGRAPRSTVVHTQGCATLRDNVVTVLGAKAMAQLQPFEASLGSGGGRCVGFVSLTAPGCGRASGDRQFLYLNGRPVDLPRVCRALNEAYRAFNAQQTPCCVLDLLLPTDAYDVNVTPDKRRVMLHGEDELLGALHAALLEAYAPQRNTFAVGGGGAAQPQRARGQKRARPDAASEEEGQWTGEGETSEDEASEGGEEGERAAPEPDARHARARIGVGEAQARAPREDAPPRGAQGLSGRRGAATLVPGGAQPSVARFAVPLPPRGGACDQAAGGEEAGPAPTDGDCAQRGSTPDDDQVMLPTPLADDRAAATAAPGAARGARTISCNLDALLSARRARLDAACGDSRAPPRRAFAAASLQSEGGAAPGDPSDVEASATAELERTFQRSDFLQLRVVGQFNLGFILAVLGEDLFIVDQHASDEIHNFERLQRTTQLNKQPLMRPLALELTPAEEQTVLQHAEVFRANGFDFEEAPVRGDQGGSRLRLTAVPVSKNTTFDATDVHELVSLLEGQAPAQGPLGSLEGGVIRPAKVRSMLAMRACRCSVMIGRALDRQQMERILAHLAALRAPWNCPHGRPTMRHLADLSSASHLR